MATPDTYRIIQVNRWERQGGVARIAGYLHEAYRHRGYDSYRVVNHKETASPYVWCIPEEQMRSLKVLDELITGHNTIIHVHSPDSWESFNLTALPEWSKRVPMVFHLHDAWLFTGDCSHFLGCNGWRVGCDGSWCLRFPLAMTDGLGVKRSVRHNWELKRRIFRRSQLYVVSPCQWLMGKARESILNPAIVESRVICHGVDTGIFCPGDKRETRRLLGLPLDALIILFINQGAWRDYSLAFATMKHLCQRFASTSMLLLCLGQGLRLKGAPIDHVLFIDHQTPEEVTAYYQASDIYLHAALADTFPNVVLEGMACGLPVVTTDVGGIPEQVQHGTTGFFVPAGASELMTGYADLLLRDEALRRRMGDAAVEDTHLRFGLDEMVDGFLQWYVQILDCID